MTVPGASQTFLSRPRPPDRRCHPCPSTGTCSEGDRPVGWVPVSGPRHIPGLCVDPTGDGWPEPLGGGKPSTEPVRGLLFPGPDIDNGAGRGLSRDWDEACPEGWWPLSGPAWPSPTLEENRRRCPSRSGPSIWGGGGGGGDLSEQCGYSVVIAASLGHLPEQLHPDVNSNLVSELQAPGGR